MNVEVRRDRYGYHAGDKFYQRVTTLCAGIPKDALPAWAARTVAEYAYDYPESWQGLSRKAAVDYLKSVPWLVRDEAADLGTAIHEAIEALIRKRPLPDMEVEEELNCAMHVETFLKDWTVTGSEVMVFHETLGYAGTVDVLAAKDGYAWLLDWKTSSGIYPNMAVQLAAYLNATHALIRKKPTKKDHWVGEWIRWPKADRIGIVHVRPEALHFHPINPQAHGRLWSVFRAAAHVKKFLLDTDDWHKPARLNVFEEPDYLNSKTSALTRGD